MIVHFSAHISKWELVCKFGVIFHIFIISCLCSRFHVRNQWFFYSVITFSYIKCFVHSYTVDVVFTLSYMIHPIGDRNDASNRNSFLRTKYKIIMVTSSNGNVFRVTGHLCGEITGDRWIPRTNGQWRGALMFSLICAWLNCWVNNGEAGDLIRQRAHYDVIVIMISVLI